MKTTLLLFSTLLCLQLSTMGQNQDWAVTSDSSGSADNGYTTAIDNAGNRYVAGNYADTLWINGNAYPNDTTDGTLDGFVAKYDANGSLLWVQTINGISHQTVRSMQVNPLTGEVYISGRFFYDFYIDGVKQNTLTYVAYPGSFGRTYIAKFNSDGTLAWSDNTYSTTGYATDGAYSLALAPDGNSVYLHTTFIADVQFEAGPLYSDSGFGASGVLLSRHDAATGGVIAARNSIPGYLFDGYILTTDNDGNLIFAGSHRLICAQEFDPVFACDTNPSPAISQGFILKMDANFSSIWGKEISGTGIEAVSAVATDNNGNIYAYGTYNSDITLGSLNLDTVGSKYNVFIAKLNSGGTFIFAKNLNADILTITNYPDDFEAPFAVDGAGNIYAGGAFAGTLQYGTNSIVSDAFPSPHYSNGFLLKLNKQGKIRWGEKFVGDDGPFDKTTVHGLAVNKNNIAAGGHMVNYNAYHGDTIYSDNDAYWLNAMQDCDLKVKIVASSLLVDSLNPVTLTATSKPGYSYQWTFNNADIPGANSSTYVTTLPGKYRCVITYNLCTLTSNKIILSPLMRMSGAMAGEVQIYPNPAHEQFTMSLPQAAAGEQIFIQIFDNTARAVSETTMQIQADNKLHIVLPGNMPAGAYLVRTAGTSFNTASPLIIE